MVVIGEDIDHLLWKADRCDMWCHGDRRVVPKWVILSERLFDKHIQERVANVSCRN
ncbi:Uncharacterised protein [Vibrio cholerae]|uniref:Uncharacterized protein n=1 Tax=Vibrio cholerae TaxID=666 RepID=A0A655Z2C7_VIBCL|nr:Uncharacterised protein [Vibrio cholerae]